VLIFEKNEVMPEVYTEYQLRKLNTFKISSVASYYVELNSLAEARLFLRDRFFNSLQSLIIGSGSNLLFTSDFDGIVIKPDIKGIEVVDEDRQYVYVRAGAGEIWDNLVEWTVEKGYYGLENLSHIPGTVGASAVQNIGAYGVEAADVIHSVESLDVETIETIRFNNEDCLFGYRDSIFKNKVKGSLMITYVTYKLNKKPSFKTEYGNIKEEIEHLGGEMTQIKLRQAVINIRKRKLPDPDEIGNAGSFFKNPVVSKLYAEKLMQEFPQIPNYEVNKNEIKIPAAWLIENAGLKGYREGNVGTYPTQPLVIVNYGNATGLEIKNFAQQIIEKVHVKFGIVLEPEVNII
jgi:UDP-N-acetylmuramate dehydrogenase